MLNLVPAIKSIEDQLADEKAEYQKRIKPYKDSLAALREINEACERCDGKGKILRSRSCAEDDRPDPNDPRDYNTCPQCGGSGLATKPAKADRNSRFAQDFQGINP